jgi:hypothetical protein
LGILNQERLDDAHMVDLGGVRDEIFATQMEILAENEVLDSGSDNVGGDSEDEVYFKGNGNHSSARPDFKAGARVMYLGQGGDETHLGYVSEVHVDGGGGAPYYTVDLEECGQTQTKGQYYL